MNSLLTSLLVACIPALISLVGIIVTVKDGNSKMIIQFKHELELHEAVQDEKISELTREVRAHNTFGDRISALETRTEVLDTLVNRKGSKAS